MKTNVTSKVYKQHSKSTVATVDIIPLATRAVQKLINGSQTHVLRRYFGSHYGIEDLIMDTVEKVVRANPMYLTRSYINSAARCVFIDLLYKKRKLHQVEDPSTAEVEGIIIVDDDSDGSHTSLEDHVTGDIHNHMEDMEDSLMTHLNEKDQMLYKLLISHELYADIADKLGIAVRTLERRVHDLRWKMEYLLTEENPDDKR
jgi:RNA polymerase sigma factor (sigma-70 family)